MLTLKNFEHQISGGMLKKGRDYFNNGAVISLEEPKKDYWQAEVEGTELYETAVQLKNTTQVVDYSCNCPYEGELCKHVIAVLFAIQEETNKPGQEKTQHSKREAFENLLQKVTLGEYQEFIRHYASGHNDFKAEFELWFAGKDERIDLAKNYETLVRKRIRKYANSGFIDYYSSYDLYNEMNMFLSSVEEHISRGNFLEAFMLAKVALKEMMEVLPYSDDSDGSIGAAISENIRQIGAVTEDKATPIELKEQIFQFLEASLNNKVYFDYGDFGYELFDLFKTLAFQLKQPEAFLAFIDSQLPQLTGEFKDYQRDFYKTEKIEFLQKIGRTAEAEQLLLQHLDIVAVRQAEVSKALSKKDYAKAKNLIAEGIKIAEKKDHPGTVSQWLEELLRIAVLEKNVEAIRYYAKHFAFDRGFARAYYLQWKKTYPAEEWKEIIEEFIEAKLKQTQKEEEKRKGQSWYAPHFSLLYALAPIYIEEKYWDRLLALVKTANHFDTAWQYHEHLVKHHPLELLELYLPALELKAEQVSQRSHYADLVWKMRKISKDIPQGKEKILALAQRLKEKYARRPAMIDELNKILK